MKMKAQNEEATLVRRFYRTELFANAVGAPLAIAYGGFMIDFSGITILRFLVGAGLIMIANQLILAVPFNLVLGSQIRSRLSAWRSSTQDAGHDEDLYRFIARLPLLQSSLVFARISISAIGVLLLIREAFSSVSHFAGVLTFGLYAGFFTGIVIYYYLRNAVSGTMQELVARLPPDSPLMQETKPGRKAAFLAGLPLIIPTAITSLGIWFLVVSLRQNPDRMTFFAPRIVAALAMNVLTVAPLSIASRWFHARRLGIIQSALDDMVDRGDTSRTVPSDLNDDYAMTAYQINRAFDLFRFVLARMESASSELSGTVTRFSSQIAQTVAVTNEQSDSVKDMLDTMDGASLIGKRFQVEAGNLGDNARESGAFVDEGFGKVQDTIHKMDEIKDANLQTLHEIGELSDEISSIGEIIDIINGIANQTRIIAFNAELEASSAGAAGTSFRIVAEEIRRLANGTVESLVGIKSRIGQIQHGSDRLLGASEEGTTRIAEGLRLSGDLNDIFKRIRQSSESTAGSAVGIGNILAEQNVAFEQVFQNLQLISGGTSLVLSSMQTSGSEVGRLQNLIGDLKQVLSRFGYDSLYRTKSPAKEEAL